METGIRDYLGRIDDLAGKEGDCYRIDQGTGPDACVEDGAAVADAAGGGAADGATTRRPPLWVVCYVGVPGDGDLTVFTYGLSLVDHPDFSATGERRELIVSVRSVHLEWARAAGAAARRFRGECSFSPGTILDLGAPIAPDTEMSAFCVFLPSVLDKEHSVVEAAGRRIRLVQAYPIHEAEADLIEERGVVPFFHDASLDLEDPRRACAAP